MEKIEETTRWVRFERKCMMDKRGSLTNSDLKKYREVANEIVADIGLVRAATPACLRITDEYCNMMQEMIDYLDLAGQLKRKLGGIQEWIREDLEELWV